MNECAKVVDHIYAMHSMYLFYAFPFSWIDKNNYEKWREWDQNKYCAKMC